ncbi:hypothetical protein CEXT_190681 [Caerostris extrusa]|uniref:Transmembrane protein n=1 Tax=Caerostris extrusa TaxID=172846 RepID=A0AAV4RWE1_CAEEX|nr:hypothetical protein CEXT_190681 [Caerostris extrusa]
MSFIEEGKALVGKASFTVLSVMFLMSWFELNVFDVSGVVLLIRICRQEVEGFRLRLDWLRLESERSFGS